MTRPTRIMQSLLVPAVAVVVGVMVGTLATRAYFPKPTRPAWWNEVAAAERKSLQGTARRFLDLDDSKRDELVTLHRTLHADNDAGDQARLAIASYRDWVGGLTAEERVQYDSASDSERAELYQKYRQSEPLVTGVEAEETGSGNATEVPKVPRLTDTQVMNVFHLAERSLELSAEEERLLKRTLGMNRVWLTLTYSLRDAPGGRGPLPVLWPPIPLAREIAQKLPDGAARDHLLSLREKDSAKWIGKTIAIHLQQDMNRVMRDLVGGEEIPRLTSGSSRLLQNRRVASDERLDAAAEALGITAAEMRLTIRWVIQTSGRGGNGQGRVFGNRPSSREPLLKRPAP